METVEAEVKRKLFTVDEYYRMAAAGILHEDSRVELISDTTLRYDRNRKLPLYRKAGVPEVWIEDLQGEVILVYRDPDPNAWSTSLVFHPDDAISCAAFPDVVFKVRDLLGAPAAE
jgi:Uma2 family endonuclease